MAKFLKPELSEIKQSLELFISRIDDEDLKRQKASELLEESQEKQRKLELENVELQNQKASVLANCKAALANLNRKMSMMNNETQFGEKQIKIYLQAMENEKLVQQVVRLKGELELGGEEEDVLRKKLEEAEAKIVMIENEKKEVEDKDREILVNYKSKILMNSEEIERLRKENCELRQKNDSLSESEANLLEAREDLEAAIEDLEKDKGELCEEVMELRRYLQAKDDQLAASQSKERATRKYAERIKSEQTRKRSNTIVSDVDDNQEEIHGLPNNNMDSITACEEDDNFCSNCNSRGHTLIQCRDPCRRCVRFHSHLTSECRFKNYTGKKNKRRKY